MTMHNNAGAVSWGYRICGDLRNGYSPWLIASNTQAASMGITMDQARGEVFAASVWLYPDTIGVVKPSNTIAMMYRHSNPLAPAR